MQHQAAISAARLEGKIGSVQKVIVDIAEDNLATARSMADAPEIDGVVHVQQVEGVKPGDIIEVVIEASDEHDLFARPVDACIDD